MSFRPESAPFRFTRITSSKSSKKVAVAAGIKNADFKTATFVQIARTGESIDCWDDEAS